MSTATKRMNIFRILFSSEIDVEEYDYANVTLPQELQSALSDISKKEEKIKKGFNASSKGGFTKKIDPKTEEAMRAMHSKVVNKGSKDIGERE